LPRAAAVHAADKERAVTPCFAEHCRASSHFISHLTLVETESRVAHPRTLLVIPPLVSTLVLDYSTRLAGLTHELLVSCLWAGPCFISSTAPSTVELLPASSRPQVHAKRASSGASALCEVIRQCGVAFRVIKSTLHFTDVGTPSWSTIPTRIRLFNVFTFLLTITTPSRPFRPS
jgi:hypothetical protein